MVKLRFAEPEEWRAILILQKPLVRRYLQFPRLCSICCQRSGRQ